MELTRSDKKMVSDYFENLAPARSRQNFIQYFEMLIEYGMDDQDGDVTEDIKRIANEEEDKLIEKINAVATDMDCGIEWSEGEISGIVRKIRALAGISRSRVGDIGILSLVAQILVKEYGELYKGQELIDKNIALMRYLLSYDLRKNLGTLVNNSDFQNVSAELLYLVKDIAVAEAIFHMLGTFHNKDLHEAIFSMRGAVFQNKRWAPLNQVYAKALKIADDLWARGSRLTRNEMADYLSTDDRLISTHRFDELNYERLRKELGVIAKKYGKLPKRGRPSKNK